MFDICYTIICKLFEKSAHFKKLINFLKCAIADVNYLIEDIDDTF